MLFRSGRSIEIAETEYAIRGRGYFRDTKDIEAIVAKMAITQIRDAQFDTDGEGTPDLDEILFGTNYADSKSHPALTITPSPVPSHVRAQWVSQPYRVYQIEQSSDLSSWNPIELPAVETTPMPSHRDHPLSPTNQFFRLRVLKALRD